MKYNININQLAIKELAPELDITDAAILDYIIVICNSKNERIEEQRIKSGDVSLTWIDMGNLLKDMPLLNISSRSSLTPRFKKLVDAGFISVTKKRVKGHVRLFVKLDTKVDSLFVKLDGPVRETGQASEKPVRETGPIINTSNTIHNNTIDPGVLDQLFSEFWKEYPKKIAKDSCLKKWLKFTPMQALTIVEDVKVRKSKDVQWLDGYAPHPSTYLNQKRWNDEILTYRPGRSKLPEGTPYIKNKYANVKVTTIKNEIKPKSNE